MATKEFDTRQLLTMPFAFTQDKLLTAEQFLRDSKSNGIQIKMEDLKQLYQADILSPLFLEIEHPNSEINKFENYEFDSHNNSQNYLSIYNALKENRLDDCFSKPYRDQYPYEIQDSKKGWWNGYYYSSWQILFLEHALQKLSIKNNFGVEVESNDNTKLATIQLIIGAIYFLPEIVGVFTSVNDASQEEYRQLRKAPNIVDVYKSYGISSQNLSSFAEFLLGYSHQKDDLISWWPLVRHSKLAGWQKLKGKTLNYTYQRIAAEVLLRTHEFLELEFNLKPLFNTSISRAWHPLMDRVSFNEDSGNSLAIELAQYGLSPHPRVIVICEGKTEKIHLEKLLRVVDLLAEEKVKVISANGSDIDTALAVKSIVTPVPGPTIGPHRKMYPPSSAIIVMDPENKYETPEKVARQKNAIQREVRNELLNLGIELHEDELELLVKFFIWPSQKYELANFSDEELVNAIIIVHEHNNESDVETFRNRVKREVERARENQIDLKHTLKALNIKLDKVELAEALSNCILEKFEFQRRNGVFSTPILQLIEMVSANYYVLRTGNFVFKQEINLVEDPQVDVSE